LRPAQLLRLFSFYSPALPHHFSLSLHDALPISTVFFSKHRLQNVCCLQSLSSGGCVRLQICRRRRRRQPPIKSPTTADQLSPVIDRKSTRLNSSHVSISYAVFCLKKKNNIRTRT